MTEASAVGVFSSAIALVLEISSKEPTCAATADALPGGAGTLKSALAANGENTIRAQAGATARNTCRRMHPLSGEWVETAGRLPTGGVWENQPEGDLPPYVLSKSSVADRSATGGGEVLVVG